MLERFDANCFIDFIFELSLIPSLREERDDCSVNRQSNQGELS